MVAADYTIYIPQQIHLALGQVASEMAVQWSTLDGSDALESEVVYGLSPTELTETVQGESVRSFLRRRSVSSAYSGDERS